MSGILKPWEPGCGRCVVDGEVNGKPFLVCTEQCGIPEGPPPFGPPQPGDCGIRTDSNGDVSCPACEECGWFTLVYEGDKLLARCQNCGHGIGIAIVECCDLHGRNCEPPSELCCRFCTEARHAFWTDERGVQRYGHPAGEACALRPEG